MYKLIIKPLLFLMQPEKAHHFTFKSLKFLLALPFAKTICKFLYDPKNEEVEFLGLKFKNKVGLAAGFDKDGKYMDELACLGFGFIEVGTVTPLAQPGNDQPRLFRLPEDNAIINRMGFNNLGLEELVKKLKIRKTDIIIGGNIGKNKITPNENATSDYLKCFEALFPWVDYFVVNVSSPNTPNLRELQDKEPLTKLLTEINVLNNELANRYTRNKKPVLLKIAPDLNHTQLDDIIEIVQNSKTDGIVATNTTIGRENLKTDAQTVTEIANGGLSGKPVTLKSTEVIRYISQKTKGKMPIIGVGGIHSAADAQEKIDAGASLVQLYTGFIYQGPSLIKEICKNNKK